MGLKQRMEKVIKVDLLVLTSLDQLLFKMQILFTFYKKATTLKRRITVLSILLVFLGWSNEFLLTIRRSNSGRQFRSTVGDRQGRNFARFAEIASKSTPRPPDVLPTPVYDSSVADGDGLPAQGCWTCCKSSWWHRRYDSKSWKHCGVAAWTPSPGKKEVFIHILF